MLDSDWLQLDAIIYQENLHPFISMMGKYFFFYIYKYCFLTKLNHSTEVLEKKIYNIFVHWPFFVRVCVHVCVCVNK